MVFMSILNISEKKKGIQSQGRRRKVGKVCKVCSLNYMDACMYVKRYIPR